MGILEIMGAPLSAAFDGGKAGQSPDWIFQLCGEWDRQHTGDADALRAGLLCRSALLKAYRLGQAQRPEIEKAAPVLEHQGRQVDNR